AAGRGALRSGRRERAGERSTRGEAPRDLGEQDLPARDGKPRWSRRPRRGEAHCGNEPRHFNNSLRSPNMPPSERRRTTLWSLALAVSLAACSSNSAGPNGSGTGGRGTGGVGVGVGGASGLGGSAPSDAGNDVAADGPSDGGSDIASDGPGEGGTDVATDAVSDGAPAVDGSALPACSSLVNPLYVMSGDTQVP